MSPPRTEGTADPATLETALPAAPAAWERTDSGGGIVEYRLPDEVGVCAAAKLTVRPDLLGESAVRVDRTQGCRTAGVTRYDDVQAAVAAVEATLEVVPGED